MEKFRASVGQEDSPTSPPSLFLLQQNREPLSGLYDCECVCGTAESHVELQRAEIR